MFVTSKSWATFELRANELSRRPAETRGNVWKAPMGPPVVSKALRQDNQQAAGKIDPRGTHFNGFIQTSSPKNDIPVLR